MSFSQKLLWTAVLALLAVLGNYFRMSLYFGLDLIWGSVAAMVALAVLGWWPALLVALAGGAYTLVLWGHPYAMLVLALELLLVAALRRRLPQLALADAVFWLLAGVPLVALFYGGVMGMDADTMLVVAFKQVFNGILNALLASFAVLALRRLRPGLIDAEAAGLSVRALVFNAFLAVGLGVSIASMVVYSHRAGQDQYLGVGQALDAAARRTVQYLERDGRTPQEAVDMVAAGEGFQLALFSPSGVLLARRGESHLLLPGTVRDLGAAHPGLSIWLPGGNMAAVTRWRRGHFMLELPRAGLGGLRVVVEQPAAPAVERLEQGHRFMLGFMAVVTLLSVALAWLLSRWLTRPLAELEAVSRGLPGRVLAGEAVRVERRSEVLEIDGLRRSLQGMADIMASYLDEVRNARESLARQVRERTQDLAQREESLRQSKQLLDAIVENIPAMVFVKRADDLRFELFNRAGERLLGRYRTELLGRNDHDFFPREQADAFTARDREVLASGQLLDIPEEPVTTADGRVRWLHTRTIGLRDEGGVPRYLLGISEDITERRETERALTEFQSTLDRTLDGVLLFDARSLGFFYANQGATRLLGYSREELLAMHPHDLLDAVSAREFRAQLAPLLYGEREALTREAEFRGKDGRLLPVEVSFQYLVMPGKGQVPRFVAIVRDISERRRGEAALRASEARLNLALAAARTSLWDANPLTGRITLDSHWAELIGEAPREMQVSFQELAARVPPEEAPTVLARMMAAIKGQTQDYLSEHRVRHHDGHWLWIESRGRVVERDAGGRALRMIGTNTDISERKRIDQLKSEFVSTVSHELRTPLTSITGAIGLLASGRLGELPPPAREMLDLAQRNSERLAHLINDLLDMERLSAGKMQFDPRVQPLLPLARQAIDELRAFGAQFGVRFVLDERLPQEARVRVDGGRLQQVLTNFLSNAIKFSPADGQVEVVVEQRGERARVTVIDHGPGIPARFRERIFQKFSQADASDTRQRGGTGLGLAISKELMAHMGGTVGFDSEEGRGARFYCELPLARAADGGGAAGAAS